MIKNITFCKIGFTLIFANMGCQQVFIFPNILKIPHIFGTPFKTSKQYFKASFPGTK